MDATIVTLRDRIEELRGSGPPFTLKDAVGIVVPLAVELAELHDAGQTVYVYPSSIVLDEEGDWRLSPDLAARPPVHRRDRVCMAPEERGGGPGNARATVFALGAMLYELSTGENVGPGMRRPSDVVPGLPAEFDVVLSKALVGDPTHRPDDLKALAQAIHHLSPTGSTPPPPADESHLDHVGDLDVDVSMSLMPPLPRANPVTNAYDVVIRDVVPQAPAIDDVTSELTALKQRLESDPRPRYVVARHGMDHGPFNAVELLQQIASHTFEENDLLRDSIANDERYIKEWPEFAPFAEHAKRHRDIVAEKVALEHSVEQEKKGTIGKAFIGMGLVGAFMVVGGVWFLARAGMRSDDVAVQKETVTSVETEGALAAAKAAGGKGRRVIGSQGGIPMLAGGMSCEAAMNAYVEEIKIGGGKMQADITQAQYGAVLNSGGYLLGCGAPDNMTIDICAAVQNGRAVGVTVRTSPNSPGVASCINRKVRSISFPAHPKLDVTRTRFGAAQ